jgi:hypothetical protein
MNSILLSEQSVSCVVKICTTIEKNCASNPQSVEMAIGIADYVQNNGHVSQKQAVWICRNADYWKMKRPPELTKVVVSNNKKTQQLDAAEVLSQQQQQPNDISLQVLRSVKRIEKLLNERLAP